MDVYKHNEKVTSFTLGECDRVGFLNALSNLAIMSCRDAARNIFWDGKLGAGVADVRRVIAANALYVAAQNGQLGFAGDKAVAAHDFYLQGIEAGVRRRHPNNAQWADSAVTFAAKSMTVHESAGSLNAAAAAPEQPTPPAS